MATRDEAPAAIEGAQILVCGLKITPTSRPLILPSKELVFPFDVKRGGNGTIEQENPSKERRFRSYSFLDSGDMITGHHLWGFSSSPFKAGDVNVGQAGQSSSHSGQDITRRGTCFLEIINGWRGTPLLTHPRQELFP